jgi:uncharacterized repeat protein (TIGR03847 family)
MDERIDIELDPVEHLTTDALGPKGQRIFYLQGWKGDQVVTLIVEKFQVQSLGAGVEQFLAEIQNKFPHLPEAAGDYDEVKMHISPPVDPLFRVGDIGLGYDADRDLSVLVVREMVREGMDPDSAGVVRYWCTRSQLRILGRWGGEVSARGRPLCPQCGQPEGPEGHFCPKKNGHKH